MPTTRLCQLLAAGLLLSCLALAQSKSPKDYADSAKKKFSVEDFQGAVQDYSQALATETNAKKIKDYEKELLKAKQHYYQQMVEEAAKRTSRQAQVELLSRARLLGIEHTGGKLGSGLFGRKKFSEVVAECKQARQRIISELGSEFEQEADKKSFLVALSIYKEAARLDPQQSQALAETKDRIDQQMNLGIQLAEEAWEALQAKEHKRANDHLIEAEKAYPGQDRVREGRLQIERDVSEYRSHKSRAEQLDKANRAEGADAYRAALEAHPELGAADKLADRIEALHFRIKKDQAKDQATDQAWDAHKRGDYFLSQQLFEDLCLSDPTDEDACGGLQEARSMRKFLEAEGLMEDGQYQKGRRALEEALELDADNSKAQELLNLDNQYQRHVDEGRRLFRKSQKDQNPDDCEQAIIHFRAARRLNADRFGKEGLDALVDEGDCKTVIPLPFEILTSGLHSYLDGQPSEAIDYLEAALDEVGQGRVEVHALLGAAYCFSGLFQGTQDSAKLEMGRQQFRLALNADPEYRLSESLFSPRILRIFEEVRTELQRAETEPSQPEAVPPENR